MAEMDFSQMLTEVEDTLKTIREAVNPALLKQTIAQLEKEASSPDLWDNPEKAQEVTSRLSTAQNTLRQIAQTEAWLEDIKTLEELGQEAQDSQALEEAYSELLSLREKLTDLEINTLLDGEYDERQAVITIRSGAGGTEATDWAAMLLRMYLRWAEQHHFKTRVLNTSYGEEGGIKSVTFQVNEPYAYGKLSAEGGTHRLVRNSPFDNQGRRQTSFAGVEVIPLVAATDHIDIPDSEIRVDTFQASGPGGQGVNTTYSAVRITHLPTNIVVSMQDERSQIQNRAAAMQVLESRLLVIRREEERKKRKELAGDVKASWGDQIRSYIMTPYQLVKDHRTGYETSNISAVFDGDLDPFLDADIRWRHQQEQEK